MNDRKEWRAMVHMYHIKFHAVIFPWPCVFFDRPPVLRWLDAIIRWHQHTHYDALMKSYLSSADGWDAVTYCGWFKL